MKVDLYERIWLWMASLMIAAFLNQYRPADALGEKWQRQLLDEGGVAVEDLAAADLDGDGRLDIAAVGRASHNLRIYRNLGD